MAPEPEVAIVIPCYGYASYLPEAVASVVAQTYQNIRCIIVDPSSPDDTQAVAQKLIADNPGRRIELLRQPNRGLSASRNEAIASCSSPLILCLDADDCLAENAIETLVQAFEAHPGIAVAHPAGREFGDTSASIPAVPVTQDRLVHQNCLPYCSMFTRNAWERVGGYDETMQIGYEDWDLWISMLERGAHFMPVDAELFFYRKHGRSMFDNAMDKDIGIRSYIICKHPRLYRTEEVELAHRITQLGDRTPDAALRLGIVHFYVEAGCPTGAISHARSILEEHGRTLDPAARAYLRFAEGYGYLGADDPHQAVWPLHEATHLCPHNATYWRALALGHYHNGSTYKAANALQTALDLDPAAPEGLVLQRLMGLAPAGV